ncbi:MAG TPA: thiamine phosphate synthase [Candidatus Sumerlaeota bacterium]|nr:thiamine phosphate synthase [Candidatus Sumerlaeota bacterium]HPS03329.1 thiamine phosphate synthase [Candidatus Sumerlaeota bacterium]
MTPSRPGPWGLYLLSDDEMVRSERFPALVREAAAAGLRVVQLRAKDLDPEVVERVGLELRQITHATGIQFIVNDDPWLALHLNADGVHVGQGDISPLEARLIVGPDKLVGFSTHNREQIEQAQELPVDYIGVGPVFPTVSKEFPDPETGVELIEWACRNSRLPAVAIGGIALDNVESVLATGAENVAVISAICGAADPVGAVREFLERIESFQKKTQDPGENAPR